MPHDDSIEKLYCALLFLLTRQARSPSMDLPEMIREHLHWLANHAESRNLPMLRNTCRRLTLHWQPGPQIRVPGSETQTCKQRRFNLH